MVDAKIIHQQLKKIKFSGGVWNQAELRELPKIIHEGEEISECVNGFYEGGVALLIATEMRLLLIDKKPLKFLTVEDFRFDMINEIDYSHRLLNATVRVSTGSKTLKFSSLNDVRLRHLIGLVQEHMTNNKKDQAAKADNQQQHLQEINTQLQMYLMAQHNYLQQQMLNQQSGGKVAEGDAQPPKPSPQLSDYLFTQQLLNNFHEEKGTTPDIIEGERADTPTANAAAPTGTATPPKPTNETLVDDARKEVFGNFTGHLAPPARQPVQRETGDNPASFFKGLEINPLRIAYSKLPMMLRNRKFGRPSFHAHSEQPSMPSGTAAPTT